MTLSEEKDLKKSRNQLKILQNRITISFRFGHIKTWEDMYKMLGVERLNGTPKEISWSELKDYLQKQKDELEQRYAKSTETQTVAEVNTKVNGQIKQERLHIQGNEEIHTKLQRITQSSDDSKDKAIEVEVVTDKGERAAINAKDITKFSEPRVEYKYNVANYGLFESPNWNIFHYWFQKKAIRDLLKLIVGLDPAQYENLAAYKAAYEDPTVFKYPKAGVLLLSPTGTGKTYMMAALFRILWDIGYHENKTYSHIPYLLISKSTVLEQISRALKKNYKLAPVADVEVINIEMLRSNRGKMWVLKKDEVINGEEVTTFSWKPNMNPVVVALDESQGAKNVASIRNRGSAQGQIMCAYSDIKRYAQLVCVSASPFTRVCEAKCFAVSTHKDLTFILGKRSPFPEKTKLNNDNWPTYAALIAEPASPFDYVQAAIERLMEDLKDYIVRVVGVKSQFKGRNSVKVIPFPNDESRQRYLKAWDVMQERKAKADAMKGVEGASQECMFAILTAFTMAAEKEHAETWANDMHSLVTKKNKAAVCNAKFKGTIIAAFKELIKLGVTRDQISIIWGGGQTAQTQKQKDREAIKKKEEALKSMGLTAEEIIADLGLEDVEDRVIENFPPEWRLGIQSKDERQSEIDRFQSGKTLYCFYTLKAGGVGLSLHHTDELVPEIYGREARIALAEIEYIPPEFAPIINDINVGNIDEATKKFSKLKADHPIPNQLHHCLVRILRCRRKESGFVVEEDVPFNPVRQRKCKGTLSYNPIELVQCVGRVPRLTSQSDTDQEIDVFASTYEVEMGYVVSQKLRCLSSVVKQKEDWQDIIMGSTASERAQKVKQLVASTEGLPDDTDGELIDEQESEDED